MNLSDKMELIEQIFGLFDTGDEATTGFDEQETEVILEALELLHRKLRESNESN